MLDPTGPAPGAVPPRVLSALRGEAEVQSTAETSGHSAARARAELALARLDQKVAALAEARALCSADTPENAFALQVRTLEVGQAAIATYTHFRALAEQV